MVDLCAHRFLHDEKKRREWQDPQAILVDLGVKKGFTFVDVGCGSGFFALAAARLVGQRGVVYGLDADSDVIDELKERAEVEGLNNLKLKVGVAEETVFCHSCADMVFFGIVLHDFVDPGRVLSNAKDMLKPSGRLIDLDWKKKPMRLGPPLQIRFDVEKASNLIASAGFRIIETKKGSYHYTIVAMQQS